jgi:hypothetical protein
MLFSSPWTLLLTYGPNLPQQTTTNSITKQQQAATRA